MHSSKWRLLALNPKSDVSLYLSPRTTTEGGTISRGTDLFIHRASSGTIHFYLRHWSTKQNETSILQIISEDTARDFIVESTEIMDSERNRILEHFPDIF
jgi:hypothetical protein